VSRSPQGEGVVGLLCAIFAGGPPRLSGAGCMNRADLFDAANAVSDDIARAKAICRRCTCLAACAEWAEGQKHLVGVVAGVYHRAKRYEQDDEIPTDTEGVDND
jgi:hypothetical protein